MIEIAWGLNSILYGFIQLGAISWVMLSAVVHDFLVFLQPPV